MDIRFHKEVISAGYENDRWEVQTQDNLYRTTNLVVAAGCNHEPFLPIWPGQDLFKVKMMHSSHYKTGIPFKGEKVLVVGFGNSGGEIAIDLWEHGAKVSLAIRSAVNVIPRELFGVPILSIGILQSKLPPAWQMQSTLQSYVSSSMTLQDMGSANYPTDRSLKFNVMDTFRSLILAQ